ncbi:bile acid:sodium symporter family protein [Lichenifustis flavocetrariae]|uniref:Bile acid:sodium symporter n=1 Tax=Lichenifustis flavocetrariae TaxID=2949735 RepID=A0AA41Z149_9HYPH|nr:bile acid:sodium symporter family protein [Lichenifustis flavocetrariae]MCW6507362.1 bile acid:sodium symporter [Lichenifustis flavocetrariae]
MRLMLPDSFTLLLVGTVGLATILPARGEAAVGVGLFTNVMIALLFFMYGTRLSREAILGGIRNWRLHLLVLSITFGLFPLLGLAVVQALGSHLDPILGTGLMFLAVLPSTVQSSIAFTSIAGGNVAAAICSASLSNVIGVVATPALVALLLHLKGGVSLDAMGQIFLQILLPFVVGHLLRRWTSAFVTRHRHLFAPLDRGSILLVVYSAFSEAVKNGIWTKLSVDDFLFIVAVDLAILAVIMVAATLLGRLFRFDRADEIAILFCGSKKSLASGVPMASVLLPAASVGIAILPLMIFHQVQLIACAFIARRIAARQVAVESGTPAEA